MTTNIESRLTDIARKALDIARSEAVKFGSPYVCTLHLLLGLLHDGTDTCSQWSLHTWPDGSRMSMFDRLLFNLGVDKLQLRQMVERSLPKAEERVKYLGRTQEFEDAVLEAVTFSSGLMCGYTGTEHLFVGLCKQPRASASRLLRCELPRPINFDKVVAAFPQPTAYEYAPSVGAADHADETIARYQADEYPMSLRGWSQNLRDAIALADKFVAESKNTPA